jgi:hypothetical protein
MLPAMSAGTDTVLVTIPRDLIPSLPLLSRELTDHMHRLLERNTEGTLTAAEREALETLVPMAQLAHILVMAAQGAAPSPRSE